MSPEEKAAKLAQIDAIAESMAPFFTPIPFRNPPRKVEVTCDACGETMQYTFSRLKKGICRSCNSTLSGSSYQMAKTKFALDGKRHC